MEIAARLCKIINKKCLKQSAVAKAAGYTPRQFNDLLHGRKKFTASDVVPICKAVGITPNELFGYQLGPGINHDGAA